MVGLQFLLWLGAHREWDRYFPGDRHYLYVPMAVAAVLFGLYIHIAPEARYLLLMGWFVALLFGTGLAGFFEVVALGGLMTSIYLGVTGLRAIRVEAVSFTFEAIHGIVFFAINVFGGMVFERLRHERRETKKLREELARRAVTDPLTGLPNRRYLKEFLRSELARIRRYGGACALAMIDVDNFKHYNDTLGHMAGDEVLQRLAAVFQTHLRVSDVVARYGGEEFGLVMVNTDRDDGRRTADRLREHIDTATFDHEDVQPSGQITVSVGLATCPEDGDTYEKLLEKADGALYAAKREGKNRVHAA